MQSGLPLGRGERLAWFVVLPLLLYLLLTGAGATAGVFLAPFRVVSLVLLAVLLVGWAAVAWLRPDARPRTTLALPAVLCIVTLALSSVASSDPRAGAEFVGYAAILGTLYALLVVLLGRPAIERRVVIVVAVATVTLSAAYIASVIIAWVDWWRLIGGFAIPPLRPTYQGLTYEAPGILSAFLVSAAASTVAFLAGGGRRERAAAVAIAVVAGIAVVLGGTRGAWAGIGVAVVVTGVAAILTGGRWRLPTSTRGRTALGILGVVAVVALVAVGPALLRRFIAGGGEEARVIFATVSLRMASSHPVLGVGPGMWGTLRTANTLAGEQDYYIPHAHNVALQTLAETGIAGVLVGVILVVAVLRLIVPALRSTVTATRALGLGALFVGTYLLIHQMVDSFMDNPAVLFAAVLPVAALDARAVAAGSVDTRRSPSRLTAAIPLLAGLVAVVLLVRVEWAAMLDTRAADLLAAGRPAAALDTISDAERRDPGQSSYAWIDGLAAANAGDVQRARTDFAEVGRQDDLPQAWLNLAALDVASGDQGAARDHLQRALRLGEQQPAVAVPATVLWLRLGDPAAATRSAVAALSVAPSLADDPWWATMTGLSAARDAAVDDIEHTGDPSLAWQVAMYAGDTSAADVAAAKLPPDQASVANLAIDAWAGKPGTRQALDAAATTPSGVGAALWAARVAARDGDENAASRYRRLVELSSRPAGTDLGYDTEVSDTDDVTLQVPGPAANLQFFHVHRRAAPFVTLIEGLPRLTMR